MTAITDLKRMTVIAENSIYLLRNLQDADKTEYLRILKETALIPELFEMDFYEETAWNVAQRPDESLTVPIIRKGDKEYLGQFVLKQFDRRTIEIGLDLKSAYQNQGIGTAVITMLLSEIHNLFPGNQVIARAYSDNARSIHLIKKVGGMKLSEMPTEYEAVKAVMEQFMDETGIKVPKLPAEDREKHIDIFRL